MLRDMSPNVWPALGIEMHKVIASWSQIPNDLIIRLASREPGLTNCNCVHVGLSDVVNKHIRLDSHRVGIDKTQGIANRDTFSVPSIPQSGDWRHPADPWQPGAECRSLVPPQECGVVGTQ